jgi:CubicO group peptidase (beta-lactamase class C family)
VHASVAGWADLASRRTMDPAATMMAYSMSKPVTAVAVLALVEEGRLGLDDPIARHLATDPYDPAITVRQLLCHTSGIPNPVPLRWVHPAGAHDAFDEGEALARALREHPKTHSRPGARYLYSNIGYWLLGEIVASVSRRPFTDYVEERILLRLGLAPAELAYGIPDPIRHASGYLARRSLMNLARAILIDRELVGPTAGPWIEIRPHCVNGAAFGGLIGTARAFGAFLSDLLAPRSAMLGDEARALLFAPQRTSDGGTIPMTLGWHVGSRDGIRFFYKEGGGGAFHAMMRLYPDRGMGTVAIGNAAGFPAGAALDAFDRRIVL